MFGGKEKGLNGGERRQKRPIKHGHVTPARGGCVGHTGPEGLSGRGAHSSHTAWATRGLLATFASRALPHVLHPYLGHPNSDFKSSFAVCDFDTVCDLQARAVKNSEAASKRHAAGLAKEGVASLDGGDHSDDEDIGDGPREGVESGELPLHREVATSTPSRKGKEKVAALGVSDC
ncbi:hypothetical protein LWI29_030770 [Acer saccharum]|uniref:Uncharacterized protein n=1 Tax=Acer saccharum TaxID=4024 RepID=A0AA39VB03_ACESA|nr:hypothetical protein LWI29_030770 [Acer saccharum]